MKRESMKPVSGFPYKALMGRAVVNWKPITGIVSRIVASALHIAKREGIYLIRLSMTAIFFSFGILRVVGLMTFQVSGNLCIAILASTLIFAPAFAVIPFVLMIACLLILSTRGR